MKQSFESSVEKTSDQEKMKVFQEKYKFLLEEIHKVIVGQDKVVEEILITLFARGHALLIGVPGLAKTLLVKTLAGVLDWHFKRIQFTPDMMPSDITGTEILQTDPESQERRMQFVKGPIFANLILADEINRTPPKTQSALLEAMQEYTVTSSGHTYPLEQPFFVAATQNPIEHEGTYPLPEAQLDRFMFSIEIDYPGREEEIRVVEETTSRDFMPVQPVFSKQEVMEYQNLVRRIPVSKHVLEFAVDLVKATRPAPENTHISKYVEWGAGPRASQYLILGAKSLSLIKGMPAPSCREVREVAFAVLRHRVLLNYNATGQGVDSQQIIYYLVQTVKEPDYLGKSAKKPILVQNPLPANPTGYAKPSPADKK